MSDPDVFRFNDLPDELKLKVYEQYFLETAIHMCHFNDKKNNFCFNGMPSLNLELTCKAVCKESRKARARHISTTVIISEEFFLRKNMKKFAASSKYAWLRKHIRQLKIAASTASIGERRLEENWLKFVPCLPNLQGVELNLPCTLIVSPIAREDFSSISAFHDFLGGAIRRFGDPEATINEYSLATTYGLNALAVALNATEKSGKIQVDFRHWAVSRLDPDDSYFSVDTCFNVGIDGIKITHKVVEGEGIHACWHGKGAKPHVQLEWELKKGKKKTKVQGDQEKATKNIIHMIGGLIVDEVD